MLLIAMMCGWYVQVSNIIINSRLSSAMSILNEDRDSLFRTILPIELLNEIFTQCAGDSSTLFACTLLSQACRRGAQQCLFSKIFIYPARQSRSLDAFTAFLDGRQDIVLFIHTVYIGAVPEEPNAAPSRLEDLRSIISRLPRLHAFLLNRLYIEIPPLPYSDPMLRPKIDYLQIQNSCVQRPRERKQTFQDVLGLFSSIDTLSVGNVFFADDDDDPVNTRAQGIQKLPSGAHPPTVRALDFLPGAGGMGKLVMSCIDGQALELLYVRESGSGEYSGYQRCIDNATHLKCVEFRLTHGTPCYSCHLRSADIVAVSSPIQRPLFAFASRLSLHQCEELQTLRVIFRLNQDFHLKWDQFYSVLYSVPQTSTFSRIQLTFIVPTLTGPSDFTNLISQDQWADFVVALLRLEYLTSVDFVVTASYLSSWDLDATESTQEAALHDPARTEQCLSAVANVFKTRVDKVFSGDGRFSVRAVASLAG